MINRGTGTIKRRHSKNYISKQADARLNEAVRPYQEQGLRALEVDSFEIKYYAFTRSTTICSCKQTELIPERVNVSPDVPLTLLKQDDPISDQEITIDYSRPLFGQRGEALTLDDDTSDLDLAIDESNEYTQGKVIDSVLSSSPDCGICYRTGYLPGYEAYGFERKLFTTRSIEDVYGYNIDVTTTPHTIECTDYSGGFVEFKFEVPKYFKDVKFSVRDNHEILSDALYTSLGKTDPLTFAELKNNAGKTLAFRVYADKFTHVVLEFDLGTSPILANLAQYSRTLDWTLFETLGNLNVILPMTIQNVQSNDAIFIPKRNIMLKITDVPYLRTSQDKNLDWAVTTRVLQPVETLKYITKGFNLPY